MRPRLSPASLLTLGLTLATVAFALWAVQVTVLDAGPLHRDAREVLSESPVQHAMTTRIVAAISTSVPAGVAVDPNDVGIVAAQSLQEPQFIEAFAGALDAVQTHVVRGTVGPITLDPALVTAAVRAAGASQPALATTLAASPPLVVVISEDQIPDLARWSDLWRVVMRALAFFSLLLITYAALRVEHRAWAFGRIGRWAIVLGIGTLAVFWLLPRALLRPLGGWIAVGGAVMSAGDVLVPISLGLIGVGVLAVVGAHRWEVSDRNRTLSVIPHTAGRSASGGTQWESRV